MRLDILCRKGRYILFKRWIFYIANMVQKQTENCEEDHVLRWMSPLYAIELLIHYHQKWAVEQDKKKHLLLYEKILLLLTYFFQIESWLFDSTFFTQHIKPMKIISPPTSCIILICSPIVTAAKHHCKQWHKIHINHYFVEPILLIPTYHIVSPNMVAKTIEYASHPQLGISTGHVSVFYIE